MAKSTSIESGVQTFSLQGEQIVREVRLRSGKTRRSSLAATQATRRESDLSRRYDLEWLRQTKPPAVERARGTIQVADLFSGCGGLSIGLSEAARALQLRVEHQLAVDIDAKSLSTFARNLGATRLHEGPVEELIDGKPGSPLTSSERLLRREIGNVDVLIGGPPCQGNSALNNHTRHADPKNELYLVMARFCEVMRPKHVIIENVPGVLSDRRKVAQRTWRVLEDLGYHVSSGTINAADLGVAQLRKRNITLASLTTAVDVATAVAESATSHRPLRWAIGDLRNAGGTVFDTAPVPSAVNQRRIAFLFENDLYNLPDEERPDCHRLKDHSYVSVYGRMYWDRPAQTITTGFGSPGRGRFVHPEFQRTITPHEAARIQFFPDWFDFGDFGRSQTQLMIGNAVPAKLGYALGLQLLR